MSFYSIWGFWVVVRFKCVRSLGKEEYGVWVRFEGRSRDGVGYFLVFLGF